MKQSLLNLLDVVTWIFVLAVYIWNLFYPVSRIIWAVVVILIIISLARAIKRGITEGWNK